MKNAILLKIASLFIFLLSAQFSFGQTILTNDDFNQGVGTWTSGGQDAIWYDLDDIGEHSNWFTYNNCTNLIDHVFLLRDNSNAASSIISQTYDLSGYDSVAFEYDYGVYSMDSNGEDWFLEFSDNNGVTWQTVKQYIRTKDFYNNHCGVWGSNSKEVVTLQSSDYTFNSTNKFRLRIDASGDADFLFVDNVVVMGNTDSYGFDIFYEDFSDDTSSGNASDFSGTDEINNIPWTADEQGSANRWKIEGGKWRGKQVSTPSSLTTGAFSISGYQALQFEFFIEYKELENTQNEWVRVFYTIDDGTEQTLVEYRGEESDQTYTVNLPSTAVGNNIVLRIEMHHDSNKDEHKIDNIRLKGFDPNYIGPVNLFFEDQADASQSGSTISGSGTSATNPSGITWTMNDPGGDVQVHNGDHIHCSKLDGDTVTWETGDIIISGYTNLNFTVFAQKIDNFGSSDYIKLQYSIDGGTTRVNIATYNTNLTDTNIGGDINTLTSTTVAGDTLKIYIEVYIDDDEEEFKWEDITLTGTPFYNVWQGTNVDLVTDTAKWSKGSQPTEATNVWIPNTKHLKLIDDQAYNTVNARATSQLTIEKTGSLTTVGDFTKIAGTGAVTLNSSSTEFASIIVGGTATGDIKYNRFTHRVASWNWGWDLAGSPVLGLDLNDFYNTNTNDGTGGPLDTQGDIIALGTYNNEWDSWSLYTTSTIVNAGNFITGKGYQIAASIAGGNTMGQTIAYTGQIATQTQTTPIINNNGTNVVGKRWNLVANPFPSYIKANEHADPINNFIKVNENILDLNYGAIYGKRSDGTPGYIIYNNARGSTGPATPLLIAPGQGFLVAAASADVAQLQFTSEMRTVDGGDDFISGAPVLNNYLLNLKLFHGNSEEAETIFYFQQGLSDGLDPGYDAGSPNQAIPLSTRLTENDQGINFSINAMDIDAVNSEVIPLVINQQEGQPFRISISENTIPEDVNVYLEDTQNGTLTSLKDQDFELIAQSDLSDAGRFYIRFTTQNLAVNDVLSPSSLTVFKLNTDAFVTIQGLTPEMGKTTATLYNMLGMEIRSKTLNTSQSAQQISTQGLASGVYIINLKAGDQVISKKVIIQ